MSEQEKQTPVTPETTETKPVTEPEQSGEASVTTETAPTTSQITGRSSGLYIVAGVAVLAILLGALYFMEKEGRSNTDVFGWLIESQQANSVVATVNGSDITGSDLTASIEQFRQVASAQGADVTDPSVQDSIREQALQVLINTELLTQAAATEGISVSAEEAQTRLDEITAELGGPEVLNERIAELGISQEKLLADIQEEVLIERYLDQLFAEAEIAVSEEEISAFYEQAGTEGAELPPLDDNVRAQIEQQIATEQEQAAIDEKLNELREEAAIEMTE